MFSDHNVIILEINKNDNFKNPTYLKIKKKF